MSRTTFRSAPAAALPLSVAGIFAAADAPKLFGARRRQRGDLLQGAFAERTGTGRTGIKVDVIDSVKEAPIAPLAMQTYGWNRAEARRVCGGAGLT